MSIKIKKKVIVVLEFDAEIEGNELSDLEAKVNAIWATKHLLFKDFDFKKPIDLSVNGFGDGLAGGLKTIGYKSSLSQVVRCECE